jgi:cobalt-precorrin 5A hydrolase
LSGHLGGANALAHLAAEILDCQPVITTATDLNGRFAVDVFAKENGCKILDLVAAKLVSAALLAGESVGFYSEIPCTGTVPKGLLLCDRDGMPEDGSQKPTVGIAVTAEKDCLPFEKTAVLVPPIYVMGIGCRRGREADAIQKAAMDCLDGLQLYPEAVSALASIDLKKEEEGILALSDAWGVPFLTYPEEDLLAVPGDFTPSAFVKKVTGVENVCERSAVLASGGGTLTAKKAAADGVTTALARKNGGIRF